MLAQDLEAAIGPAVALLLVGFERVGQQAVAVAAVGVVRDASRARGCSGRDRCPRQMVSLDQPPAASSAARRIRHIVPCTMMALSSLRCTMPISKKPAYSPFMA